MEKRPLALVTGSSSGFGFLTSLNLAKAGFMFLATMRNPDGQEGLYGAADQWGVAEWIQVFPLDVTHSDSILALKQKIETMGRLDVLVNNAGFATGGIIEEVTNEQWREQFDTNFFGLVAMTKAVLPMMREARSGRIINMSSVSGRMGFPALAPYVASKHAVEGFSECLRLEMKSFGVDVILIEPGSYATNIWSTGKRVADSPKNSPYLPLIEKIENRLKEEEKGFGDPQEVANLIVKAATSKRPKLRYTLGRGVRLGLALRSILPWKSWERLVDWNLQK